MLYSSYEYCWGKGCFLWWFFGIRCICSLFILPNVWLFYEGLLELCICVGPLLINLGGNIWTCNYCSVNLLVRYFFSLILSLLYLSVFFIPVNVFAPMIMDFPKLLHVFSHRIYQNQEFIYSWEHLVCEILGWSVGNASTIWNNWSTVICLA